MEEIDLKLTRAEAVYLLQLVKRDKRKGNAWNPYPYIHDRETTLKKLSDNIGPYKSEWML